MILDALFTLILAPVVYTYLGYPLALYLLTHSRKDPTPAPSSELPFVTVITSAYNEESVIVAKIENLLGLDYPRDRLRILIGSDGSTDDTVELAKSALPEESNIEIIDFPERRGKPSVLRDLIARSDSEVISMSDANTLYEPDALQRLTRWFSDEEIGCVCGRLDLVPASPVGRSEQFYWRMETRLKQMENRLGGVLGANGGIYAFRRSAYEPLSEDTITDDFVLPMLIRKRGYRIIFDSDAVALEETAPTVQHEFTRRTRIGAGNLQALWRTRSLLRPRAGWTAFTYWSHKVARWATPIFLLSAFLISLLRIDLRFYQAVAGAGIVLLVTAVVGWLLERRGRQLPTLLAMPYAFIAMNVALLLGAIRFIRGEQFARWSRTPRGAKSIEGC